MTNTLRRERDPESFSKSDVNHVGVMVVIGEEI